MGKGYDDFLTSFGAGYVINTMPLYFNDIGVIKTAVAQRKIYSRPQGMLSTIVFFVMPTGSRIPTRILTAL